MHEDECKCFWVISSRFCRSILDLSSGMVGDSNRRSKGLDQQWKRQWSGISRGRQLKNESQNLTLTLYKNCY